MRPTTIAAAVPAAIASALLTACSSGLKVVPPEPVGAEAYACAALHGRLPDEVDGQTVTDVEPRSPFTNAWGDPAIVLRCGVPVPAALTPTSQLLVVDGVSWLPEKLTRGYLFTTVGLALNVEVSVPDAYSPEANALADLSPVIAANVATASPSPSPSAS